MLQSEQSAPMSLRDYADAIGADQLRLVLKTAGTTPAYYRLMAYHFKRCTPDLFERIEAAAAIFTPGVAPDYEHCTRPSIAAEGAKARAERGRARRAQWAEGRLRQVDEQRA